MGVGIRITSIGSCWLGRPDSSCGTQNLCQRRWVLCVNYSKKVKVLRSSATNWGFCRSLLSIKWSIEFLTNFLGVRFLRILLGHSGILFLNLELEFDSLISKILRFSFNSPTTRKSRFFESCSFGRKANKSSHFSLSSAYFSDPHHSWK